jgi:nitrate/nitrite transport system substrate-binding protein
MADSEEKVTSDFIRATVLRALVPHDETRRRFLSAVGASTAYSALGAVFPFGALEAMAQDKKPPEKKDLKIGFIAITCASPLIMADPLGFYREQGLQVQLMKTAGWALIRDKMINKEHDASHFLSPMPLAMSMGLGSAQSPMRVCTIQNVNGQRSRWPRSTRTSATRRAGRASSSPCRSSTRCTTSCCATTWRSTASTRTPTSRSASRRRPRWWRTCAPATSTAFSARSVQPARGVRRGGLHPHPVEGHLERPPVLRVRRAGGDDQGSAEYLLGALPRRPYRRAHGARAEEPRLMAKVIAPPNYLNQPETVIEQVLTGRYADGLGEVKNVPTAPTSIPSPGTRWRVWILTQMKRWGYVKGDVNYKGIAEQVFPRHRSEEAHGELDMKSPASSYAKFKVDGQGVSIRRLPGQVPRRLRHQEGA